MVIIGIVAIVLLGGFGVFYAVVHPMLSGNIYGLPWGLLLLIAAAAVLIYLRRHRSSKSGTSGAGVEEADQNASS